MHNILMRRVFAELIWRLLIPSSRNVTLQSTEISQEIFIVPCQVQVYEIVYSNKSQAQIIPLLALLLTRMTLIGFIPNY